MRRVLSITILFMLPLLATILWQCNPCGCTKISKIYTKINRLTMWHQDTLKNQDTTLSHIQVSHHVVQMNSAIQSIVKSEKSFLEQFAFPTAYACSCVEEGDLGLKNKIKRLDVLLEEDYDTKYTKGKNINDLVIIDDGNGTKNYIALDNAMNIVNDFLGHFYYHALELRIKHTAEFYQRLNNQSNGVPFSIKIRLTMEDNSTLETLPKTVVLTN